MRSLRLRLTLVFVGMAAALIVAAGTGTSTLVDRAVWGPLDAAPLEEATTLESIWFWRGGTSGGSGLGLALCHEIVAVHGGRIDLTSEPGRGTRIVVTLP